MSKYYLNQLQYLQTKRTQALLGFTGVVCNTMAHNYSIITSPKEVSTYEVDILFLGVTLLTLDKHQWYN